MHDTTGNKPEGQRMTVQHIVMLGFNDGVDKETKKHALAAVNALKGKIDGIERIECGEDFSGRAGDITHAFIVTMRDRDTLTAYGPHPAHKEVQEILHPVVKTLLVVDFEPS
tara:strand:- start:2453 stop:2788 length:336 start_codon:yes stop_codon:yes gene_type:complete